MALPNLTIQNPETGEHISLQMSIQATDAASATKSEAFAVGERNGVPVESGDPTYQNNAKYYRDQMREIIDEAQTEGYINVVTAVADAYSASKTYNVGEYSIHDGKLYRCVVKITTAEAWTSAHWTQVNVGEDLSKTVWNEVQNLTAAQQSAARNNIMAADEVTVAFHTSQIDNLQFRKQDKLTFDSTPTAGSSNPVTSAGIKTVTDALAGDVDDLKSAITPLQSAINGITFDPGDFTDKAMIIYDTGAKSTTSSTAMMATGFIAIPNGATKLFVTMRVVSSTSNTGLAFYTSAAESAYISGSRERTATSGWELREIDIPSTAKYFRSTYFTNSASVEHPPFAAYTDLAFDNRLDAMQEQIDSAIIDTVGVEPVNVYNPDDPDIITGKTVSYNGNYNDVADFKVSGFIEIEPGATYIIPRYTMYFGSSDIRYLPCYNADKTYASSKDMTSSLDTYFRVYTFPANTTYKYFRVNISMYDANSNRIVTPYHTESNFMVIKGTALPKRYIPFVRQRLMDTTVYSAHEELDNPLYGKSIVFFGDSIVEGGDDSGYCRRIGERNSMLWLNNGIGGSTIASTSAGKTICTRAAIMADPDYIVLEGGTNDADRIGNATGETKPANFGTWDPDEYGTDDTETYYGFDITTFCGAVDYMCKRFVSTYPGKKIGFIGAHKMGQVLATRKNRGYYIQTAMDICKKWGIPCLDLWNGCYLNPMIPSHYTANEDYLYADGQHLTHNGYDYLTPIIEAWLKTL